MYVAAQSTTVIICQRKKSDSLKHDIRATNHIYELSTATLALQHVIKLMFMEVYLRVVLPNSELEDNAQCDDH